VIGTAFFVMDYVEGRVIWDPTLAELSRGERKAHYDELNRVIAALHRVDPAAVGLGDYGKPGNYLARQIDRWSRQYRASETERIEAMDRLIEWLPANVPPGDETSIVHGDYRIDNVVFHPTEPRILAVLDWELSTLGHPLADFAYHCMTWRMPEGAHARGLAGLDLHALGIPTEDEYIAAYCRRTGRESIAHFQYYIAYNMFRLERSSRASWRARCRATPRAPTRRPRASERARSRKRVGGRPAGCSPRARKGEESNGFRVLGQDEGAAGEGFRLHAVACIPRRGGVRPRGRGQPPRGDPWKPTRRRRA
jgi:aminoglycoside phosphotransferase (APT) family kinase protein